MQPTKRPHKLQNIHYLVLGRKSFEPGLQKAQGGGWCQQGPLFEDDSCRRIQIEKRRDRKGFHLQIRKALLHQEVTTILYTAYANKRTAGKGVRSITWRIRIVETGSGCYGSWWVDGTRWRPLTCNQDPALGRWQTGHGAQSQLGLKEHGRPIESWRDFIMRIGRRTKFFFSRMLCNL